MDWTINWRKVGVIVAIAAGIAILPSIYIWLFPPHDLYCVVERNGEIVKAWDEDCTSPDVRGEVIPGPTFKSLF